MPGCPREDKPRGRSRSDSIRSMPDFVERYPEVEVDSASHRPDRVIETLDLAYAIAGNVPEDMIAHRLSPTVPVRGASPIP